MRASAESQSSGASLSLGFNTRARFSTPGALRAAACDGGCDAGSRPGRSTRAPRVQRRQRGGDGGGARGEGRREGRGAARGARGAAHAGVLGTDVTDVTAGPSRRLLTQACPPDARPPDACPPGGAAAACSPHRRDRRLRFRPSARAPSRQGCRAACAACGWKARGKSAVTPVTHVAPVAPVAPVMNVTPVTPA